ncbi:MAG: fused DSP-PTPase phosphatase/NAD kinase-like protein [Candidatus Omnitrophota bacterium]
MNRKLVILPLVMAFVAALLGRLPEAFPQNAPSVSAKNFCEVKPGFYRGGKPSLTDLEKLRGMGVNMIIDFTMANRQAEREKARELGMNYVNIPWDTDTWMTWFYDYDRVAKKFFELIEDPSNHPVYVHCFSGRDRTGMMVALYRMEKEGWSYDEAIAEMKGFGYDEKSYPNLADYLRRAGQDRSRLTSNHSVPLSGGHRLFQHTVEEKNAR